MNQYNLPKLPKSSKKIMILLSDEGTMTQKEIIAKSKIPAKTVRYALRKLSDENLIVSRPSLLDMRSSFYSLNPDFNMLVNKHIEEAKITIEG